MTLTKINRQWFTGTPRIGAHLLCAAMVMLTSPGCSVVVHKKIQDNEEKANTPCTQLDECNDGNACNGLEMCAPDAEGADAKGCVTGLPAPNGTTCDGDGDANTPEICVSGSCVTKKCGDGFVDTNSSNGNTPEQCDDGNAIDDDGCTQMCKYSCTKESDCAYLSQNNPCMGAPTCNLMQHRCRAGLLLSGISCSVNNMSGTCQSGTCVIP